MSHYKVFLKDTSISHINEMLFKYVSTANGPHKTAAIVYLGINAGTILNTCVWGCVCVRACVCCVPGPLLHISN